MTRRGYAICQITGWTAWSLTILMYVRLSGTGITARGVLWAAIEGVLGFAISHAYRAVVRTRRWAALPLRRLAPRVFVASVLQAVALDATMCAVLWLTLGPDDPPLRLDIPQDAITIGVAAYRDEAELTLGKMWAMPFAPQRPWKLPSGEVPQREPRGETELQP